MPPFEEYVDEIRSLWETHWLTNMGAKHEALRAALKAYFCLQGGTLTCLRTVIWRSSSLCRR